MPGGARAIRKGETIRGFSVNAWLRKAAAAAIYPRTFAFALAFALASAAPPEDD